MRTIRTRSSEIFTAPSRTSICVPALATIAAALSLAGLSAEAAAEPAPPSSDAVASESPRCLPWLPCREVCVEFDAAPLGGTYGAPVTPPGSLVYVENGVRVGVDLFYLPFFVAYGTATVEPQPLNPAWGIGSGQIVRANNINLSFDFTGLAFVPSAVRFEFLDLGGAENIFVDGAPLLIGDLAAAPPSVTVTSASLPPPVSGKKGTVLVKGPLHRLSIGGQELWIDRVCALGGVIGRLDLPLATPLDTPINSANQEKSP
jgi:hypothetical protein